MRVAKRKKFCGKMDKMCGVATWVPLVDLRQLCYEAALQPRPGDDVDFYLHVYHPRADSDDTKGGPRTVRVTSSGPFTNPNLDCEGPAALSAKRDPPLFLREDFSGTSMVSQLWVCSHPARRAWALDIDPECFDWAYRRHIPKLTKAQKGALQLRIQDVLKVDEAEPEIPKCDVIAANNFSWQCFKEPTLMRIYFEGVLRGLNDNGIFVLDIFGGKDTHVEGREVISTHDIILDDGSSARFSYVYEQMNISACTHDMDIGVTFEFSDGSCLPHAFKYSWRVWPMTEVRISSPTHFRYQSCTD